jgi:hypothetical protein
MQNTGTEELDSESSLEELELAERELKAALIFAQGGYLLDFPETLHH